MAKGAVTMLSRKHWFQCVESFQKSLKDILEFILTWEELELYYLNLTEMDKRLEFKGTKSKHHKNAHIHTHIYTDIHN
jgi:hypothetical protein